MRAMRRMNYAILIPVIIAVMVVACEYKTPLSEVHSIPVDPTVLGLWQEVGDQGDKLDQMLIIKYTETEYVVEYPVGPEAMFFRAYPIKIGDVSYVQVQVVGVSTGEQMRDDERGYDVISYRVSGDELEIKTLNRNLVDTKLDAASLREAFLKNAKNDNLFTNPGRFKRVVKR